jgi:hypothetical protein
MLAASRVRLHVGVLRSNSASAVDGELLGDVDMPQPP